MKRKKNLTDKLLNDVWNKKSYYDQADNFIRSAFPSHGIFLRKLDSYSLKAQTILDCGCGPATIIELIWQKNKKYFGVDISKLSIALAKKRLKNKKNIELSINNIGNLSFPDNSFDLVYAVSVVEHLIDPQTAIQEMIRVTKKGGILIIMSPNFGSPFFPSFCFPNNFSLRLKRGLKIITQSHLYLIKPAKKLNWNRVYPLVLEKKEYQSDWDTVVEPDLQTLIGFLKNKHFQILEQYSSIQILTGQIPHQLPAKSAFGWLALFFFRNLAMAAEKIKLAPYCYYGPNMFVAAKKI